LLNVECSRKEVIVFLVVVIALDLFFILANCPLMPDLLTDEPLTTGYPLAAFIRHQLDLTTECVLATWYSSILLFVTGAVALLNSQSGQLSGGLKWLSRTGWVLMGCVLIGISADEVGQIHESLAHLFNLMGQGSPRREGAGDWLPILLPFIIAVALFMALFFSLVVRKSRASMVLGLAGLAFWVASLVSEAVEGGFLRLAITYKMQSFIEESCEVIGTTSLLIAFVLFYGKQNGQRAFSSATLVAKPEALGENNATRDPTRSA
jgi:hypothetical protein